MKPFLRQVYEQYDPLKLSEYCFVFPTRRGAFVFKNFFKETPYTVWLPEFYGIRDFIARINPLPVADDTILLMKLHETVQRHGLQMPLEKFQPWGQVLLKDFNEIDQNLKDAAAVYARSFEERQMEQTFAFSEEEISDIAGFWKIFSRKPLTSLQEEFLQSWQILPKVYDDFNALLEKEKITYEGRAYRNVASLLQTGTLNVPWEKIVFSGFYALSGSEQAIFTALQNTGRADLYWDSDDYYFRNERHEAGHYLRKNPLITESFSWNGNHFHDIPRNIYITGAPLQTAQVKWLGSLLKQKLSDKSFRPEKSVIVLPDEKMLIPLLNSLPPELGSVNITMGYPASESQIASIMTSYIKLLADSFTERSQQFFFKKQLYDFISSITPGKNKQSVADSEHDVVSGRFAMELLPLEVFSITGAAALQRAINSIIDYYLQGMSSVHAVEKAVCSHVKEAVNNQFAILRPYLNTLSVKMMLHLIEELLHNLKVPFAGDKEGIQIMGFLETRTLDFENIFILSVNENLLPAFSAGKTYLPYSVRKAFKLPLRNEQDAIYSYHFYRLIQRANEIHLIYNTESKSTGGGEPGRYLLQIATELNEAAGYPVQLHFNHVSTRALMHEGVPVSVVKDAAVLDIMKKRYASEQSRGLSVTAISEYINCSLRFYLKYIAGIRKEDELPEELDARMFGSVFHTAIRLIYEGTSMVGQSDKSALLAKIEQSLHEAIKTEYGKDIKTGHDLLLKEVLAELLKRVIENDLSDAPLEMIGHELEYTGHLNAEYAGSVKVYGKIDRIDRQGDTIRIIDYKTGNDRITEKISFPELFSNPVNKVSLQLWFYSLLYKKNVPHASVKAGMYKLKTLSEGLMFINKSNVLSADQLSVFETEAVKFINELFNPSIPFSQTPDMKRCDLCDYNKICNRMEN